MDYLKRSKVNIDMTEYLKNILDDQISKYQGEAITPAANHIFEMNETTCKLREGDTQAFYTILAKLLFL